VRGNLAPGQQFRETLRQRAALYQLFWRVHCASSVSRHKINAHPASFRAARAAEFLSTRLLVTISAMQCWRESHLLHDHRHRDRAHWSLIVFALRVLLADAALQRGTPRTFVSHRCFHCATALVLESHPHRLQCENSSYRRKMLCTRDTAADSSRPPSPWLVARRSELARASPLNAAFCASAKVVNCSSASSRPCRAQRTVIRNRRQSMTRELLQLRLLLLSRRIPGRVRCSHRRSPHRRARHPRGSNSALDWRNRADHRAARAGKRSFVQKPLSHGRACGR